MKIKLIDLLSQEVEIAELINFLNNQEVEIEIKQEKEIEINNEILNKKEKEYLKAVLKPFKNRAKAIVKRSGTTKDNIIISLKGDCYIPFPDFKKGTMYKKMIPNKYYTIEELGLFENK